MADLPELSDTIYDEYRTYLFKYHEGLERLKELETIKTENEKLKTDNLTLKRQLREMEMDKKAAHFAAQTESRMLREELRKMMKKPRAKKSRKSLTSDTPISLPSNSFIPEPPTPQPEPPVTPQEARTGKRKIMETISESENPDLVAKRAKQKRTAKISLVSERAKLQKSISITSPFIQKPTPKVTLPPPQKSPVKKVAPVVPQVKSPVLPPVESIDQICEKYNWVKTNIPLLEFQKLMKSLRLSKNALQKKIDKVITEYEEEHQSKALDDMMLNLSDDDSFTNNTNHVNGNVKNEESPSKLMDSPSKRPNNVNEESTDCDADLLDSIFSQMASGKMSVTPGKINRPVKTIAPEVVAALNFDAEIIEKIEPIETVLPVAENSPITGEKPLPVLKPDQIFDKEKETEIIEKPKEITLDDVFKEMESEEESEESQDLPTIPNKKPDSPIPDKTPDSPPSPAFEETIPEILNQSFSDDEETTLLIDIDEEVSEEPVQDTNIPESNLARTLSTGFSATDTPNPESAKDKDFNLLWSSQIKSTNKTEPEDVKETTMEESKEMDDEIDSVIDKFSDSREQPYFVSQCGQHYNLGLHESLESLIDKVPIEILQYVYQVRSDGNLDEICSKIYKIIKIELRSFKKARQELKLFKRIESIFLLIALLHKGTDKMERKLTDFIVYVSENINARVNEGTAFCILCLIMYTFFSEYFKSSTLCGRIVSIAPYFTVINYCQSSNIFFNEDCFYPCSEYTTAETENGTNYKIRKVNGKLEKENYLLFSECFTKGKFVSLSLNEHPEFAYGKAVLTIQCAVNGREWCKANVEKIFQEHFKVFQEHAGGTGFTERQAKGLIHSLQIFGVSLRSHVGTKDPEGKKSLKGFSRLLPNFFKYSEDMTPLQEAIANQALLVFVYLKDAVNCKETVKTQLEELSSKRMVPDLIKSYVQD